MIVVPALHTPFPHASPAVQAFPSLQGLVLAVKVHPEAGTQVSVVHGLKSLQLTGVPPHVPLLQTSRVVQALLSSQSALFGACWQPSCGSQ